MSKTMAVLEGVAVVNIIVCADNEPETDTLITYTDANPAHIGGDYLDGYFYSPQPYPSWSKDGVGGWNAPTPMPNEGRWIWNEEQQEWQEPNDENP